MKEKTQSSNSAKSVKRTSKKKSPKIQNEISREDARALLFTDYDPSNEDPAHPSLNAIRLFFRRVTPGSKRTQKQFTIKQEFGSISCEYSVEQVRLQFSFGFDRLLASLPSEIKSMAEKAGISYHEKSHLLGIQYLSDMHKCLDHAVNL